MQSPPLAQQLARAFDAGDWPTAYQLAGMAARSAPEDPALHMVAGIAALDLGHAALAVAHLERSCRAWPHRLDLRGQLARALIESHRTADAVRVADDVLPHAGDAALLSTLGTVYSKASDHTRAAEVFGRAVALDPYDANARFNYATSLMYFGHLDEAEAQYDACLAADPAYARAHLALAQLRTQTPERNHLPRLQAALDARRDEPDAVLHVNLAMAKELEDLGEFPAAFEHLVQGKRAVSSRRGSSQAADRAAFEAVHASLAMDAAETGDPDESPIFVLGMPRTGTTLLDRMLSSHPDVASAGELGDFATALQRAAGPGHSLVDLLRNAARIRDWASVGRDYLASTRHLANGRPRFVDKMPHNFLYAGFIARALPNARIVCLRRHPMDTSLSNFRQLFALESPYHDYSFDLMDTGHYVLEFERLVAAWRDALPGRVFELPYEALVDMPEPTLRRLLEFCGLEWSPRCLEFTDNSAPVATASAAQVRSGLDRRYVDRWKRYGSALDPLRELLREGGIDPETWTATP
ncbi:tetratricopeptide repeat-containing sulfotransferase family protein [Cognatilysobacter terrigena]|uniref:tetratricopeptide repeat-containing sulfotransferase family protein n=1 Tax=Cognatilysobacter terrigena TaxID=2488749 RepID=UPI00105FCD5B|nr:sulfotransferase [Lysobacter terrigena]